MQGTSLSRAVNYEFVYRYRNAAYGTFLASCEKEYPPIGIWTQLAARYKWRLCCEEAVFRRRMTEGDHKGDGAVPCVYDDSVCPVGQRQEQWQRAQDGRTLYRMVVTWSVIFSCH